MDRQISPPPLKRRKISQSSRSTTAEAENTTTSNLTPSKSNLRIFSWNVNGIAPFITQKPISSFFSPAKSRTSAAAAAARPHPVASFRNFLRRHHWPQVLFLQEVKINPQDETTKRAVKRAVNTREDDDDDGLDYEVFFSLPQDKYNAVGFGRKVYGVAAILRSDFYIQHVLAVRQVDWDVEGRLLVVETKTKLSIWNIYAVNGTSNPYRSPQTGEVVGTRHDRKLAFHKLLLEECLQLEKDGWKLILAGDFNIARSRMDGHPNLRTRPEQHVKNRYDFNYKFFEDRNGLCAIDAFRYLHPTARKYTYHGRGIEWGSSADRVDLIILSRSLVQGDHGDNGVLQEAHILDNPAERGPSDHVPLSVSLNVGMGDDDTQVEAIHQNKQ